MEIEAYLKEKYNALEVKVGHDPAVAITGTIIVLTLAYILMCLWDWDNFYNGGQSSYAFQAMGLPVAFDYISLPIGAILIVVSLATLGPMILLR